jgi:sugar O-acyltransferase (sialic acid O-acetyltransferase NeuD family)
MGESYRVIGGGGHARVVVDALLASGKAVEGCYDDNPALDGADVVAGVRVVGVGGRLGEGWGPGTRAVVAIGDNRTRFRIAGAQPGPYGTAVAPSAVLGAEVHIGEGTVVLPSATVNARASVGRHAILNTACSVDHDCRIGDFVHVAPGCRLGGGVEVGEGTFLGIGTIVLPGVRIGRWGPAPWCASTSPTTAPPWGCRPG